MTRLQTQAGSRCPALVSHRDSDPTAKVRRALANDPERNAKQSACAKRAWARREAEQLASYPATLHLPPDYHAQIMSLYALTLDGRADVERERRDLDQRLTRLKELNKWGDIEQVAYQLERDKLTEALASLRTADDQSAALERTAEYLADLPAAWEKATPAQRNELARVLFSEVVINDNRLAAVTPQADFAPFFILDYQVRAGSSGSDGIRTRGLSLDRAAC